MKKRIYSFILLLAFIFSAPAMPASAAKIKIKTAEERVALLKGIGMVNEIDSEATLTNAQFAGYLLKIFNIHCDETKILSFAKSYNILGDYDKPEAELDFNMLCKMAVSAMGYDLEAEFAGGYPNGYINVADEYKLLKNVNQENDGKVTGEDVVNVLYNMLEVEMCTHTLANGIYIKKGTPLESMGITRAEGIVTAVYGQTLAGTKANFPEEIAVNSIVYTTEITGLNDYFAKKVCYYYDEEEEKLLYIAEDKEAVLEINASAITDIEYNNITYIVEYEDLREDEYEFKAEPKYISINGETVTDAKGLNELFDFEYGQVTAVDYDDDEIYDVLLIEKYENYFVRFKGTDFIYDTYTDREIQFDFEEDYTYIFIKDNKEVTFEDITEKSVISVYKDTSGKYIKVLICEDAVNGRLESAASEENGQKKLIIDGFPYYTKLDMSSVGIGDVTTFYLDINGNVAAYDATNIVRTLDYGFLVKLYQNDGDETIAAKIFTRNEGMIYLSTTTDLLNVSYEGKSQKYNFEGLKRSTDIPEGLLFDKDGKFIPQLVKFSSNGQVLKKLEIAPPVSEYDAKKEYFQLAGQNTDVRYGRNKIGNFAIDVDGGETWVVAIPPDEEMSKDGEYISNYVPSGYCDFSVYDTDDFQMAKVCVIKLESTNVTKNPSAVDRGIALSVVESVKLVEEYNEEDDEIEKYWEVTLGTGGKVVTHKVRYGKKAIYVGMLKWNSGSVQDESYGENRILVDTDEEVPTFLRPGDVGQIALNEGYMVAFRKWYDVEDNCMPCRHSSGESIPGYSIAGFGGSFVEGTFGYGKVTNISSKYIVIDTSNDSIPDSYSDKKYMGNAVYPAQYDKQVGYIYDSKTKKVETATLRDVKIGDNVVFNYVYFNLVSFVVLR